MFYALIRALAKLLMHAIWRIRIDGAERVPRDGPLIVASNHVSYFDPVALGVAVPRQVWYMAKVELFRIPGLAPLITALGAFPVDRRRSGRAAIKRSVELLREGRVLGIFPEGGRNREGTAQPRTGAALLATLSGAPIVPAAIAGTRHVRPFVPIRVAFGEPLHIVRDRQAKGDDLEKWTEELMRRIAALKETIGAD